MPSVDPDLLSLVSGLKIDESYLRHVVTQLTGIGSSALGFRTTGTPEDAAVAEFVAGELRAAGLTDVAVEKVEVDAWRFRSATVLAGGTTYLGSSFGGVPGTPTGGLTGRLVDAGVPLRRRLDRLDLGGAIALVDWSNGNVEPAAVALELASRGAIGMLLTCPTGGSWYQSPGALGAFNGGWSAAAPPMIFLSKEAATALRAGPAEVTMTLDAELTPGAAGSNVVGYLEGDLPGPVVVGAHHDAWFSGAFDNTSGVAALLGIARALAGAGHRPRHTICFTTRTAEEYGIADSTFDWCIGAWRQVEMTHPEWATASPFHLCVEATGHRALRTVVEAPVELTAWARRVCRAAERQGWTPTGWRVAPPVSGTEQWPYLVSGVPGVAAYAWEKSFGRTDYHTQLDTSELLDFGYLAAQSRLYALLLLAADRDPDAIIDHRARARQLGRVATGVSHEALAQAARRHAGATGRAAFSAVGRSLFALNAAGAVALPHEQALADCTALDGAVAALDSGDLRLAARRLRQVGNHSLAAYLSPEVFRAHLARFRPDAVRRSWAGASHLTQSPQLWTELASLSGEAGAPPPGPELRESLLRARDQAAGELQRRLDAMADALG